VLYRFAEFLAKLDGGDEVDDRRRREPERLEVGVQRPENIGIASKCENEYSIRKQAVLNGK
jgi:hypothetical protein